MRLLHRLHGGRLWRVRPRLRARGGALRAVPQASRGALVPHAALALAAPPPALLLLLHVRRPPASDGPREPSLRALCARHSAPSRRPHSQATGGQARGSRRSGAARHGDEGLQGTTGEHLSCSTRRRRELAHAHAHRRQRGVARQESGLIRWASARAPRGDVRRWAAAATPGPGLHRRLLRCAQSCSVYASRARKCVWIA